MKLPVNAHQLVLRRDSATGWARVDWASHIPLGRFIHIDVICDAQTIAPISKDSPLFASYERACQRARSLNVLLLQEQYQKNRTQNWLVVPLDLNDETVNTQPDEFGNYQAVATQAFYRLGRNAAEVWAVVNHETVSQVCSRWPSRPLQPLEYQVWKHHCLERLGQHPGETIEGRLVVQESGLWLAPDIG